MKINKIIDTDLDFEVTSIESDSRKVKIGTLFVCLIGLTVDGHDYVEQAISNGACCIIASRKIQCSIPVIYVKDTYETFSIVSSKFYGTPSEKMKMIGVTGTDGKTTTSSLLYQMLNESNDTAYLGTNGLYYNGSVEKTNNTTPVANELNSILAKVHATGVTKMCMEVSSHALEAKRVFGIEYDISIFTNLSHDHLLFHKTMENYQYQKSKLFQMTKKSGYCILNADDEIVDDLKVVCNGKIVTYGYKKNADFFAKEIKLYPTHSTFTLIVSNEEYEVNSPLLGAFNVSNLLACLASAVCLGYSVLEAIKLIEKITDVDGRMQVINKGQDFNVIIDFAHTPNAIENIFDYVDKLEKGKTTVILGSAGARDIEKRPLMGEIAVKRADYAIFTSDDPRHEDPYEISMQMVSTVKDEYDNYSIIVDRDEAIKKAIYEAGTDDIILIIGKGNEAVMKLDGYTIDFKDIDVASKYIETILKK